MDAKQMEELIAQGCDEIESLRERLTDMADAFRNAKSRADMQEGMKNDLFNLNVKEINDHIETKAQLTAANARAEAAEATAEKLLQMERDRFANFEAAFGTLPKPMAEAAQPTPADREGISICSAHQTPDPDCKLCNVRIADREDCDG